MSAYNAAPYLDSALASIAAQARQPDEVVLVDDGSTDGTAEIAESWTGRLPIKVIQHGDNLGVGAGRRTAIEASTGDWIALLDADDYWLPDHLEVLCRTYEREGGIVTAANYRWVPGTRIASRPSTELAPVPPAERQKTEILLGNFLFSGSIFSRELYDRVGGMRPLTTSEDWDLWIRMVRAGARVTAAPTVTALYRVHDDGLSSEDGFARANAALLEEYVTMTTGHEQRQVRKALRRQRAAALMVDGFEHIRAGRTGDGRRAMARAAFLDHSIRRGASHWGGCVALRAAACFIAPHRALAARDARRASPGACVGDGRQGLGRVPRPKTTSSR
jgi:glycosyltransferase involved in cell wall biosynthesis